MAPLTTRRETFLVSLINLVFVAYCATSDNGQFIVEINPHLSFILCSPTPEEVDDSIMRLMNVNDVYDNDVCMQSSQLDLSKDSFTLDTSHSPPLLHRRATSGTFHCILSVHHCPFEMSAYLQNAFFPHKSKTVKDQSPPNDWWQSLKPPLSMSIIFKSMPAISPLISSMVAWRQA